MVEFVIFYLQFDPKDEIVDENLDTYKSYNNCQYLNWIWLHRLLII